jgi:hypothetical protein
MPWTAEVNTADVRMALNGDDVGMVFAKPVAEGPVVLAAGTAYPVTLAAHKQIADRARIPWAYYQRMMERAPHLLCDSVNHWWQARPEIRTIVIRRDAAIDAWLPEGWPIGE